MLVGAGRQQPALVVRQAVAHEQDVVLLRRLAERLAELRLLVFDGRQDERRRVQAEAFWPLRGERTEWGVLSDVRGRRDNAALLDA